MKKCLPCVAGIILGLLFIMASVIVLFNLVKAPPPPEGSSAAMFFGALAPTGYLKFVKIFELVGGILVMIPQVRNFGLLLLGPVIINIIAFHVFIGDPKQLADFKQMWMLYVIIICALYLLWNARKKFGALLG